jgi:hypothetical protein
MHHLIERAEAYTNGSADCWPNTRIVVTNDRALSTPGVVREPRPTKYGSTSTIRDLTSLPRTRKGTLTYGTAEQQSRKAPPPQRLSSEKEKRRESRQALTIELALSSFE